MKRDLTLYFWHQGNPHYPSGHAAFRLRIDGEEMVLNYDEPEDFDRVKLRALPMYKLTDKNEWLKAQKRSEVEQRMLVEMAPVKVKIPISGNDPDVFGLWRKDPSDYKWNRTFDVNINSVHSVARILDQAGGWVYVQRPVEPRDINLPRLVVWARAVNLRVSEINHKVEELRRAIDRNVTARSYRLNNDRIMMSEKQWKELSNKDTGFSLVRSEGVRQMDRLVARYHQQTSVPHHLGVLAELIDTIHDYNQTRGVESNRQSSVLVLAKHAITVAKVGPLAYSPGFDPRGLA